MEKELISLKWGTLKSWNFNEDSDAHNFMKKYCDIGSNVSAIMQEDTPEQKELICKMIDSANCEEIYMDWDGKFVSKEEAKKYVMDYHNH